MASLNNETLQSLARALSQPQRLQEGAALAGAGIQVPMVQLRARAARRELRRIESREGEKSPAAQRQGLVVQALDDRVARSAESLTLRRIPAPSLEKGEMSLVGRVTRDGKPLEGFTLVALHGQGEPLRQTCTGRNGLYSLALPADTEVRLELRQGAKAIWRDEQVAVYPSGHRGQRPIEIGEGEPICHAGEGELSENVQMPRLIGLEQKRAEEALAALGLKLEKLGTSPSDRPGFVLAQEPEAGTGVRRGAAVALKVGAPDGRPAAAIGELAGWKLGEGLRRMGEAEVAIASLTLVEGSAGSAMIRESRITAAGDGLHLTVAVPEGDAARLDLAATVLSQSEEGRALDLASPEAAARWLEAAKISTLAEAAVAAGEDDATLRKRMGGKANQGVAMPRRALLALATRIRET
jgi:hypothetical protein